LNLAGGARAQSDVPPADSMPSKPFDFYVFTLSWSPGFCDLGGDTKSPDQCAAGANEGFVVHGLWPDNLYSANPSDCDPGATVPLAALKLTDGLYPTEGLARYEYVKHGTCTGLSAEAYFGAVKWLRGQIVIPDILKAPRQKLTLSPNDIEQAFIAGNENLEPNAMAVTCSHGELVDVRICVARDLKAYALCPKVSGHTCHAQSIAVQPLR